MDSVAKDVLGGRRCSCNHRSHGAFSSFHRKAEIELFGPRCELEHVYTRNERIAVNAVAVELRMKHLMAMTARVHGFTRVGDVDAGL